MINKLYSIFKKNLRKFRSYVLKKQVIIPLIIFLILMIPVPYHIETYGNIKNMNDKISVNGESIITGSFNLTYVVELKGTTLTYISSLINKNMDAIKNKNTKEISISNKLLLENSISNATYVAYKNAQKPANIIESKIYVAYIDNNSNTNLVVGDVINEVNGNIIENVEDYLKIVNKSEFGDKLDLIVNGNQKKYVEVKKYNYKNNTYIYIICNNKYKTDGLKLSFDKNESGSSAGLMIALTIYDKLITNDLSKKRIIAGTGVIDINGNVNEIAGIKYKLKGAERGNADIFFVPIENYKESKKYYEENNYKFELVPVKTFSDAVNYLNNN